MLAWMHAQGLATGANFHDAQGVQVGPALLRRLLGVFCEPFLLVPQTQSYEARYPAMAAANGIDPSSGQTVAFAIGNKTYADSLQATVLVPLIAQGLDL